MPQIIISESIYVDRLFKRAQKHPNNQNICMLSSHFAYFNILILTSMICIY